MGPARSLVFVLALAGCGDAPGDELGGTDTSETTTAGAGSLVSDFDESPGDNTYFGGLDDGNWTDDTYIVPNAGAQSLASGNGNPSGAFMGLGIAKDLGGMVADRSYEVSFYVAMDLEDSMPIELGDFSELWIGGSAGTMEWTQTPVPDVVDTWVQWKGRYTPAPADLGQPFVFHAIFDLPGKHSIAIDGPVIISPLP